MMRGDRESFVSFLISYTDISDRASRHWINVAQHYIIDINKLTFSFGIIGDMIDMTMTIDYDLGFLFLGYFYT